MRIGCFYRPAAKKQTRSNVHSHRQHNLLALEPLECRALLAANQVAAFGDYGHDSAGELAVSNMVDSWNVGAIAALGDNNYLDPSGIDTAIGKYYHEYIGNYKGSFGAGAATNKFFPALGNHDYHLDPTASAYLNYFTLPGNERYYDWVLGDAHFFAINTEPQEAGGNTADGAQGAWLKDALAKSTSAFNIVYNHRPPYSSGSHGSYSNAQWPFKEWGADLVLSGHDHTYERINVGGLTYVVAGLGGLGSSGGGYDFGTPVAGSQVRYNTTSGALRLTITASELKGEFFSIENGGKLIDAFTISPNGGGGGSTTPSLSIGDANIAEGDTGEKSLLVTVSLSTASSSGVTVNYATAGTSSAAAGSDYLATSGSLSFSAGQTQKVVTVTVLGDTLVEGNEQFAVRLASASGATIGRAQAIATILNDDVLIGLPTLSISDISHAEGASGSAAWLFTVTLSAPATSDVTVRYATGASTASAGGDYTATSGSLSFSVGQTQKIVTISVLGDTAIEGDETFLVNLSNVLGATLAKAQAIGTILNDDIGGPPTLSISDASRPEGASGNNPLLFTVTLSAASTSNVKVRYATAGTGSALAGSDYLATSGSLTFAPGQTQKVITVNVVGDAAVESNETFSVNLLSATGAAIAKPQALGTIVNDDGGSSSTTVRLFVGNAQIVEGDVGQRTLLFPVWLNVPSAKTVSARWYTQDKVALAGSDYVGATGVVTLAPGQTQTTIPILINGDTIDEREEYFDINLVELVNAKAGDHTARARIQDDDSGGAAQSILSALSLVRLEAAANIEIATNVNSTASISGGAPGGSVAAASNVSASADVDLGADAVATPLVAWDADVDEATLELLVRERLLA